MRISWASECQGQPQGSPSPYQCCRQWAWPSTRVPAGAGSESSPTPRAWPGAAWTENCLSFGCSAGRETTDLVRPGEQREMQCQSNRAWHSRVLLCCVFGLGTHPFCQDWFSTKAKIFRDNQNDLGKLKWKINWRLTGPLPKHADFNSVRHCRTHKNKCIFLGIHTTILKSS